MIWYNMKSHIQAYELVDIIQDLFIDLLFQKTQILQIR